MSAVRLLLYNMITTSTVKTDSVGTDSSAILAVWTGCEAQLANVANVNVSKQSNSHHVCQAAHGQWAFSQLKGDLVFSLWIRFISLYMQDYKSLHPTVTMCIPWLTDTHRDAIRTASVSLAQLDVSNSKPCKLAQGGPVLACDQICACKLTRLDI